MSLGFLFLMSVSVLAFALLIDQLRYKWPITRHIAIGIVGVLIIVISISMLIGVAGDMSAGRSVDVSRGGGKVLTVRTESPFWFWTLSITKLIGCAIFALMGFWCLVRAFRK